MDDWNPILAETHVKHVPFWKFLAIEALFALLICCGAWALAILVLSIERVS